VLGIDPRQPFAWHGLAMLARATGAAEAELALLARAVQSAPENVELRLEYAGALESGGHIALVEEQFRDLCGLRPDVPHFWEALGIARQTLGEGAGAAEAYARACALQPSALRRLKLATLVSPIAASREAIAAERRAMESAMDQLLADPAQDLGDPMRAAPWPHFYTAYHGECNRALHAKEAAVYRHLFPSLEYVAPHCREGRRVAGRIRVGLISQFLHDHSIGRTSRGFFSQLSRDAFEVTAISIAPAVDDAFSRFIRARAERCIDVPRDLAAARALIESARLDVLFYQDIGMEPFSYFLAFSRLAPVQCVSFGHPDTTGIPAIDYFVSNNRYETPEAGSHYSERLFLLRNLPTLAYYDRPERGAARRTRSDFGLAHDRHVYLCPQNLFKFHPDMDALIAGILRRDPRGELVAIAGRTGHWTELIRRRWTAAMPDVVDRIRFLPRMSAEHYVDLIEAADVMLDTIHFNGMNTSLEAFAVGTPVVTWPREFQRGRHTQAMYRAMDLDEGIVDSAEAYVERAVALGTDAARREALKRRILDRNAALFREARVVREFERFFREAVEMGTRL
jgi:predicted O-linked N-acetylglucosamine transferase (SPINDLY family)